MSKNHNIRKKSIVFLPILIIILCTIFLLMRCKITIKNESLEINNKYHVSNIVNIKNGSIEDEIISFDKLGENKFNVIYKNRFNKKNTLEISVYVVDTIEPIIELENEEISVDVGSSELDILQYVSVKDNSLEEIPIEIEGDYDLSIAGKYDLTFSAKDSSNNKTTQNFTLVVKVASKTIAQSSSAYFVRVNKTLNVAMVYGIDDKKEYTKLIKTFVVSTGENTPLGLFTTTDRYETLSLVGGVWGHAPIKLTIASPAPQLRRQKRRRATE